MRNRQARPTIGPGGRSEQLHDRVAVQVGPHASQVLVARAMRGDALLEVVVGPPQRRRPRLLRVVQSARTSLCSRGSSGPASVTYRRTAESVHSPLP